MSISGVSSGVSMRSFQPPSFKSIDSDSSEGISLEELKSGAPGGATDAKSAQRAEQLFKSMDADSDGSVTSDEKDAFDTKMQEQRQSMQFMTQMMAGPSNQNIFEATDTDSDGSISLDEFSSSEASETMSTDDVEQLFSTIDADSDGAISETESSQFLDALKSAASEAPMGPPPQGGPPPGPPPAQASAKDEEEADTTAVDLLTAATANNAYSSTKTVSDLLSTLASIFDQAA